ncbi:hypothetical protein NXS19_012930 [Fusarium pseudograminearum]|nr:hypothetical protein NXS19_012930 [Fusarium pseudograminearum]
MMCRPQLGEPDMPAPIAEGLCSLQLQTSVCSAVKECKSKSAPFTIQLLGPIKQNGANHSIDKLDPYLNLFPASYCTQSHDLASPSDNCTALIASELDINV